MFYNVFKSNSPVNIIFIPLVVVLIWSSSLFFGIQEPTDSANTVMPFYTYVNQWLHQIPQLSVVISSLLAVTVAYMLVRLNNFFLFLRHRTYLPGIIYVVLLGSLPENHLLSPSQIAAVFVLTSLFLILDSHHVQSQKQLFNSSVLMSIGSLFYLPTVALFPLLLIGVFILSRQSDWRPFVIPFIGFLLPWLFTWGYYFLSDSGSMFHDIMIVNSKLKFSFTEEIVANKELLLGILPFFLLGYGSIFFHFEEKKTSSRKYLSFFTYFLLLMVVLMVLVPGLLYSCIPLIALPSSYIIAHFFFFITNERLGGVLYFFFFVGLITYRYWGIYLPYVF